MTRMWNSIDQLTAAMRSQAETGKNVVLSPTTTMYLIRSMTEGPAKRPTSIDVYGMGSVVYLLDHKGEIENVAAWASSSLVARAAFEELCRRYPERRFEQRRRAWVEGQYPKRRNP